MGDRQSCLIAYDEGPQAIHIDSLQVTSQFADDGSRIGQRLFQVALPRLKCSPKVGRCLI